MIQIVVVMVVMIMSVIMTVIVNVIKVDESGTCYRDGGRGSNGGNLNVHRICD